MMLRFEVGGITHLPHSKYFAQLIVGRIFGDSRLNTRLGASKRGEALTNHPVLQQKEARYRSNDLSDGATLTSIVRPRLAGDLTDYEIHK
jgi:hypothetical protein